MHFTELIFLRLHPLLRCKMPRIFGYRKRRGELAGSVLPARNWQEPGAENGAPRGYQYKCVIDTLKVEKV